MEILLEEMRSNFQLVLEGHEVLRNEIREVREESNARHDQTAFLLKALARDLSAHRADTEAHPRYQVRVKGVKLDKRRFSPRNKRPKWS